MDKMIYWIILVTAIAGVGGTGLGGAISACIRRDSSKVVSLLLSFAGGVMLAVVCFDLIMDAVNTELGKQGGLITVLLGIVIGYIVVGVLNLLIDEHTNPELEHIDEAHPKTADDLDELIHSDHLEKHMQERSSLFIAGLIMAICLRAWS